MKTRVSITNSIVTILLLIITFMVMIEISDSYVMSFILSILMLLIGGSPTGSGKCERWIWEKCVEE